jgi:hypothetical protein
MTDVQLLFVVLAIIYAWECAWWFSHGSSGFRSWLGKRWQLVQPGVLLGNQKGGFIFSHPLPPLGTLLAANEFPLMLSPKGLCIAQAINVLSTAGQGLPWEKIDHIAVRGKKVLLNREPFFKAESPVLAANIAESLRKIKEAKPKEREQTIRKLFQETVDPSRIEALWTEFRNHSRALSIAANVLFAHLFIVSPALIGLLGFRRSWLVLLFTLLALTSTVAMLFHRAHKRLFLRLEDERFTHFIIILLSPATAIRARDVLSRPLFSGYHPLAVAKVFCSPADFREQAADFVRLSRYPIGVTKSGKEYSKEGTESYWRKLRHTTLEDFLRRNGLDPEQLVQPPTPVDNTCLSYCPRCRAQFTNREGICNDCGGIMLLPFVNKASSTEVPAP